jgi:hypothetical protein
VACWVMHRTAAWPHTWLTTHLVSCLSQHPAQWFELTPAPPPHPLPVMLCMGCGPQPRPSRAPFPLHHTLNLTFTPPFLDLIDPPFSPSPPERGPQPQASPVLARFDAAAGGGTISVVVRPARAIKPTLIQVGGEGLAGGGGEGSYERHDRSRGTDFECRCSRGRGVVGLDLCSEWGGRG